MKSMVLRLSLLVPVLLLSAGCVTTRETASETPGTSTSPVMLLGRVQKSGAGIMPSEPSLRMTLRNEAARQFRVPIEEIVLGNLEISEGQTMGEETQYVQSGSLVTSQPTDLHSQRSWSVSVEVGRKLPQEG